MLISLLLACPPEIPEDTATTGDTSGDTADTSDTAETGDTDTDTDSGYTGPNYSTAVVTTVSDDYASGVLATIDIDSWTITDSVATVPTDNHVVAEGGLVYVLGRYGYDYIRVYEPGSWSEPVAEFSLGDYANPQDVAMCDGNLYVSAYGTSTLTTYDPSTWLLNGAVDLSAYADADGVPEIAGMVELGDTLYVELQQLDQSSYPWLAAGGMVAAIDCATGTVSQTWNGLINVTLREWPGHDALIARTGVYFRANGTLDLDGGLMVLDPATGLSNAYVSEATLGENITDLVMVDDVHGVMLTGDAEDISTVWCWNIETNAMTELFSTGSYLQGLGADDNGNAWIVARTYWKDPSSQGGIITVDAKACVPGSETWHQDLTYAPYAVAFY